MSGYCMTGDNGKVHASGHKSGLHGKGRVCHPVIVIDAEDREQVERLTASIYHAAADRPYVGGAADGVQAALREFADPKPPKPDEPQGLGAVVEDADGTKWIRHDSAAIHKRWLNTDDCDVRYRTYDEIAAVAVLSHGAQP